MFVPLSAHLTPTLTFPDGNGCTLFTSSPGSANTFSKGVNVGQIGINVPVMGKTYFIMSED